MERDIGTVIEEILKKHNIEGEVYYNQGPLTDIRICIITRDGKEIIGKTNFIPVESEIINKLEILIKKYKTKFDININEKKK